MATNKSARKCDVTVTSPGGSGGQTGEWLAWGILPPPCWADITKEGIPPLVRI